MPDTTVTLEPEKTIFTLLELIQKAAAFKGLRIPKDASRAQSETIIKYLLDEETISFLKAHSFKIEEDYTDKTITIFSGKREGCWIFRRDKDELAISISVGLNIAPIERGVTLIPLAYGSYVSPSLDAHSHAHFKMLKMLAQLNVKTPTIIHELALSDSSIVIHWTELGLGGIRELKVLFNEFKGTNEMVQRLAQSQFNPFDPAPYPPSYQAPKDRQYITEPAQSKIITGWHKQLEEFRNSLLINS